MERPLTRKLEWEKDWEYLDVINQPDANYSDYWIGGLTK